MVAGCSESHRPPNIVLLLVDTLRSDHVGCYGAAHDTSPTIDALAAEGIRFAQAHSTAPWTSPSVASILTGQFPSGHGLKEPLTGLADEVLTLAEMLRAEGYQTGGIVSNPHLKAKYGFDQGFDHYLESEARNHKYVSTEGVTQQALGLLDEFEQSDKPFFLFILYFDPHYNYKRHPEYGFAAASAGKLKGGETIYKLRRMGPTLTPEEIGLIADIYDEEVRYTDAGIGRLLGSLRERKLYDDSVICFAADHGEEFFERGWLGHSRTLYEELLHVPFIIKAPQVTTARVVETPVSLVSVTPTLLDLARGTRDLRNSLVPVLAGETLATRPIFSEVDFVPLTEKMKEKEAHKRTVLQGSHKLIVDGQSGVVELYDLDTDPRERNNLAGESPELTHGLSVLLEHEANAARAGAVQGEAIVLSDEDLEVLKGLGYAGSGGGDHK